MNDIYMKLAHSPVTDKVLDSLSLPRPPRLERTPNASLQAPTGNILLAAAAGSRAAKPLLQALIVETAVLFSPELDKHSKPLFDAQFIQQKSGTSKSAIKPFNFNASEGRLFRSVVFDASGIETVAGLKALYNFFNQALNHLNTNARIVIVGIPPEAATTAEQAAVAESLQGFMRSLAKETGKTGTCCNLLHVRAGSERHLNAALYFLLSPKSAFITGQLLELGTTRNALRKISWELPLKGKIALVTGAAQGIGAETCRVLARDGATVVGIDLPTKKEKLKQLTDEIGGHALCFDLGEKDAALQLVNTVGAQLGVIDILVHNAGITRDKTLRKMPEQFWDQVLDINLAKIMDINQKLHNAGAFNAHARIVCISSISGIAGNFGQTNYACAKSGLAGYVRAAAKHCENGMTINAIAPGFIETEMTAAMPFMAREMGRRANTLTQGGLPLDIAETVSFFCHPAAQALNGNVLRVCGQNLVGR